MGAASVFKKRWFPGRSDACGLAAARARGRAGGCKPKLDEKDVKEIRALWCETPP